MKMTLKEVWVARQSFNAIVNQPMPFKTSYTIFRIINKIKDDFMIIETKRLELCKKYGIPNQQGINEVIPQNMEAFAKDFEEAGALECEIESPLLTEELLQNIQVSPEVLNNIDMFIKQG